jgi:hypothetical protein
MAGPAEIGSGAYEAISGIAFQTWRILPFEPPVESVDPDTARFVGNRCTAATANLGGIPTRRVGPTRPFNRIWPLPGTGHSFLLQHFGFYRLSPLVLQLP